MCVCVSVWETVYVRVFVWMMTTQTTTTSEEAGSGSSGCPSCRRHTPAVHPACSSSKHTLTHKHTTTRTHRLTIMISRCICLLLCEIHQRVKTPGGAESNRKHVTVVLRAKWRQRRTGPCVFFFHESSGDLLKFRLRFTTYQHLLLSGYILQSMAH